MRKSLLPAQEKLAEMKEFLESGEAKRGSDKKLTKATIRKAEKILQSDKKS